MPSAIRVIKRREARVRYDAALAVRRALDARGDCLCGDCRHWRNGSSSAAVLGRCCVRGSFRAPGGLFTQADFGCIHGTKP